MLAVAVTKGPLTTESFARGVMLNALHQSEDKKLTAERRQTTLEVYDKIWPAIRGVGNGTATYGDLSLIAHYAKVAMSEKADSSTTGHEVAAMAALVGGMRSSGEPIQDKEHFAMFARSLKKGESYIVLAGTNVLAEGVKTRNLSQVNHYVVVGQGRRWQDLPLRPVPTRGDPAAAIRRPELLDAVRDGGRPLEGQLHLRATELLSASRPGATRDPFTLG